MHRAIELATRGLYTTKANPRVGCVLVREGRIIGEGYHVRPGDSHAEVNAIAAASEPVAGATAFVSLEPCAHFGRTPPCANALVDAGVERVVIATSDPNPKVDGGGMQVLRDAGINVAVGLCEAESRALNPGFFARLQHGKPWLRVKVAASLDGRTALANGDSQWITSARARADVQRWRARACAILSGVDTVLADDPALTVRINSDDVPCDEADTNLPQPLRVIVDSHLRVPCTAQTFRLPGKCLVACTQAAGNKREHALRANGIEVLRLPSKNDRVDLNALMHALAAREINEVHTETGARLVGGLLNAQLVDELLWYCAPTLLGESARPGAHIGPFASMAERINFQLVDVTQLDTDLRLLLRPSLQPYV